jgi:putative endonuclease
MPIVTHTELGRLGEQAAADYLAALGWRLLGRNWHGTRGELDLIAQDGDTVVFVEVKARRSAALDDAFARVDKRKQEALAHTAEEYLEAAGLTEAAWRVDVIGVRFSDGTREIAHVPDALIW